MTRVSRTDAGSGAAGFIGDPAAHEDALRHRDGERVDFAASEAEMIERNRNAWRRPIGVQANTPRANTSSGRVADEDDARPQANAVDAGGGYVEDAREAMIARNNDLSRLGVRRH